MLPSNRKIGQNVRNLVRRQVLKALICPGLRALFVSEIMSICVGAVEGIKQIQLLHDAGFAPAGIDGFNHA